jgi:hypothetical protein
MQTVDNIITKIILHAFLHNLTGWNTVYINVFKIQ